MSKKVVFISGPFREPTPWLVECNVRNAEAISLAVWRAGGVAICPHCNTRYFDKAADDSIWLEGDLELLIRSDALLLIPNWNQSYGAVIEKSKACEINIPIFYSSVVSDSVEDLPIDLLKWLKK